MNKLTNNFNIEVIKRVSDNSDSTLQWLYNENKVVREVTKNLYLFSTVHESSSKSDGYIRGEHMFLEVKKDCVHFSHA